jgi:hypothetical protein
VRSSVEVWNMEMATCAAIYSGHVYACVYVMGLDGAMAPRASPAQLTEVVGVAALCQQLLMQLSVSAMILALVQRKKG